MFAVDGLTSVCACVISLTCFQTMWLHVTNQNTEGINLIKLEEHLVSVQDVHLFLKTKIRMVFKSNPIV